MKVAITGHTKGIGLALATMFSDRGDTVKGYSRSNGFDISKPEHQDKIIADASDCDVFINNAYHEFSQCDMLTKCFANWKYQQKTIININSRSKYGAGKSKFYAQTKKQLAAVSYKLMFTELDRQCRIININPGYVDTDMASHVPNSVNKLSPAQCAEKIIWALDQPHDIEIGELSVWCTV